MGKLVHQRTPAGGATDLQGPSHEDGAAHKQEDEEASDSLLADAQEAGLLPRCRAARLQLQAVDMRDGEHGGRHEPGQPHDGAHSQHHAHHQQVQMVPTALLHGERGEGIQPRC